jgi:hypothetical protein
MAGEDEGVGFRSDMGLRRPDLSTDLAGFLAVDDLDLGRDERPATGSMSVCKIFFVKL